MNKKRKKKEYRNYPGEKDTKTTTKQNNKKV